MRLMEQAAARTPRVVAEPAPRAMLTSFGDSAVNLAVGFWIEDPHNGIGNVRGDVLLAIWDAFNTGGVSIPSRSARCAEGRRSALAGGAAPTSYAERAVSGGTRSSPFGNVQREPP
jgi:small-conductance mechanosensitive channel